MTERHLRKYSTSLAIREMQLKTTLRFHLIPLRMAKIKNTYDNLCWRGCGVKGTLLHCWWECKLVQPPLDISMAISQKIRKQPSSRPSNTTFWYIPKGCSIIPNKDMCSTMFITTLFVIGRTQKQPKCSLIKDQIKKIWCIYTMQYYTAEKKIMTS